ncbi:hypothetical protein BST79_gp339 [Only Syngen Nebraska virus 5]|uniref:hypothetical protein n=1 Tax=Only Syngen Nebraska virus 5 TaxID=1917232 RepID=UPI00090134A7|nr:hypothetical protein BST79_gp339 [Only Syngen Nebraska virus 5]APC25852.1 hypothetical protein [Only Syngen Nebraska virus 5]
MINMEDFETFKTTFYICGCGYKTILPGNASRHKKTSCGHEMKSESRNFIWEEDVKKAIGNTNQTNITVPGDHNTVIGKYIDQKQITFNLTVPDGDTRTIIYKALKSPQFQRELNGEFQPENIPALIFRHTKGTGVTKPGGEKAIHVEDDKVHEKDPAGNLMKTPLNKYAKKFINDATTSLETNADVIQPKFAKELVDDFKTDNLPGHKKNEKVSGAKALKNYAAGTNIVYKYPVETRGFVDRAVDAVKKEIRNVGNS